MYCNWLSRREGLPESEWVYPANEAAFGDGMMMPADYLRRTGYRLPTEPEWEFAARAGTTTSRFFGSADTLLPEFAWFSRHPPKKKSDAIDPADPQRTSPVGRLVDQGARTRRGGAFPYEAAMARSAARGTITSLPTNRRDNVGFRVARTIR